MKTQEYIIRRYENVQDKWYDIGSWEKIKEARSSLQSMKNLQSGQTYKLVKRTTVENKIKA
jgi:hypothetical protein